MSKTPNEELEELLRASARGDGAAFKFLYDETAPRLLAVSVTLMQDSALAEDVLQEAFVQIWHRAGEYHSDRGSVFTWLTTIVRYRAIDLMRKRRRGHRPGGTTVIDVDPAEIDFLNSSNIEGDDDSQRGPLAAAISSEENTNLQDCVERLSNRQQKSVALAFFRGFTHQELADCLAEPLGTIKSRLRRSLLRLKDCLKNMDNEIEA